MHNGWTHLTLTNSKEIYQASTWLQTVGAMIVCLHAGRNSRGNTKSQYSKSVRMWMGPRKYSRQIPGRRKMLKRLLW